MAIPGVFSAPSVLRHLSDVLTHLPSYLPIYLRSCGQVGRWERCPVVGFFSFLFRLLRRLSCLFYGVRPADLCAFQGVRYLGGLCCLPFSTRVRPTDLPAQEGRPVENLGEGCVALSPILGAWCVGSSSCAVVFFRVLPRRCCNSSSQRQP